MVIKIVDNIWKDLEIYCLTNNFLLITDNNLYEIYKDEIDNLIKSRENIHLIKDGEKNKNLEELTNIYKALIKNKIDREGMILSLGGGLVGDLAGFAAANYKRGINYIQIPTTLLAQVDSSIGGKTGIDFEGHKNILGSFHFPLMTLVDYSFILTLPEKEITSGLGEIIKYGIIHDYEFLKYIEKNIHNIYKKDIKVLSNIIRKSITIKTTIVKEDKMDLGLRQKLNFGHTIGHSIESYFAYEKYNHGQAIIMGMIYESNIAYEKGLIDKAYYIEILKILTPLVALNKYTEEDIKVLIDIMKQDKKNKNNRVGFVLPIGRGLVDIFYDIEEDMIAKTLLKDIVLDFDLI